MVAGNKTNYRSKIDGSYFVAKDEKTIEAETKVKELVAKNKSHQRS